MRSAFLAAGFALILSAGALTVLGHHDGLLGATPIASMPGPGQPSNDVITRVTVAGSPDAALALVDKLGQQGLAPMWVIDAAFAGQLVTARFEQAPDRAIVLVQFGSEAPVIGDVLVVAGKATAIRTGPDATPILVMESGSVREPLVFKHV